jgi:CRP-like cAMP-binding protein
MPGSLQQVLCAMLQKFELRVPLTDADRQALLDLPFAPRQFDPGQFLIREGNSATHSALIVSGLAYRHKSTVDGDRQILSFHVPGDFIDLEGSLLSVADHNVQALTRCELALVPTGAVRQLMTGHPLLAQAMWVDTLIDASVFREWIVNVGQRDARGRIAHILCEFACRLRLAGMSGPDGYELPVTQEHLADATGLTTVHVSRTLMTLEREGLVLRQKRFIAIPDWDKLKQAAGFNDLYLHLDQVKALA